MKFRKKPVVIDAIQWTGGNYEEIVRQFNTLNVHRSVSLLLIETLEGNMTAMVGDWIIRGVRGEVYPCKPDIFAETYEVAE